MPTCTRGVSVDAAASDAIDVESYLEDVAVVDYHQICDNSAASAPAWPGYGFSVQTSGTSCGSRGSIQEDRVTRSPLRGGNTFVTKQPPLEAESTSQVTSVSPTPTATRESICSTFKRKLYWPWFQNVASKVPFFTVIILLLIWSFFLWGAAASNATIKWSSPISPADSSYWFRAVTSYPDCTNLRGEGWRLISYQFAHEGLMHIGANTLFTLTYGWLAEFAHPYGF